jgi:heme ABC exporter ATP-binding subunit CcmA
MPDATASQKTVVRTTGLSVRYGWRTVLRDISLELESGQVLAILGPNAAGKTTLLRTLAGAIQPEKGEIRFQNGEKTSAVVGWVGHQSFLYDELTVEENLRFWADLLDAAEPKKRIGELAERFELNLLLDEPVETLSHGQIKRVAICRALLHEPKLLLLDEAFNGLDRVGADRLLKLLAECRNSDRAVILTSHQISLALQVATHLAVLHKGRMLIFGKLSDFDTEALAEDYLAYATSRSAEPIGGRK